MKTKFFHSRLGLLMWLATALTVKVCPAADFFDNFDGPEMNEAWVPGGFPTKLKPNLYPFQVTYAGLPGVEFQKTPDVSVLRMGVELPPLHRAGWTLDKVFPSSKFRCEVRLNTVKQSSITSIDGCIEIWLLDAANSNRCDVVGLFSSYFGTSPRFMTGSTIDCSYNVPEFEYTNDTWYKLVIEGGKDEKIRASLCDDQGRVLISYTFSHDTSVYGGGVKIGLSQAIGTPTKVSPTDIAVDYLYVTEGAGR